MTPTAHLNELHYTYHREHYPGVPAHAIPKPQYKLNTTNGMTRAIMDFIKFNGGYAERINVMGRKIKAKSGKEIYIPTSGARGSADISAVIRGRAVKIEVKNLHTRDRMHADQQTYAERVRSAGALYFVAHTFDEFYNWYLETF